jgi:hypothetical protein
MYEDALNQFWSLFYAARFTPKQSLAQHCQKSKLIVHNVMGAF